MPSLALRSVVRQKTRSAMVLAAVAFGAASLVLIGGFVRDMFEQLAEATIHSRTGHVQLASPGYFTSGSRSPEKFVIAQPAALGERISSLPFVKDAMARMSFSGLLNNGKTDFPIVAEGIEPDKEARLGTYIVLTQGRSLRDSDAFGMLIGEGLAQSLSLHPGDRVNLVAATADGAMNVLDFVVVGVFQSFSRDYDARAVKIPISAARELLDTVGANVIVVSLRRTADTNEATRRLRAGNPSLEVRPWYEVDDFYGKAVTLYERQFVVLKLIIMIMIVLSVSNLITMTILERAGEFGTMRALGVRSRRVFTHVIQEGVILGVAGATLGCVLGLGLAWLASAIGIPMPPPPNSNIEYTARISPDLAVCLAAFAIGLLASVVASLSPALAVCRLPIAEALRRIV